MTQRGPERPIPELIVPPGASPSPALIAARFAVDDALLVRGLSVDVAAFEALTRNCCRGFHRPSRSRAPVDGDGYTFQVFDGNFVLLGHSEASFMPLVQKDAHGRPASHSRPDVCFFLCAAAPAEEGGETTIVDGIRFLEELPAALRRRFECAPVTYGMSWPQERWLNEFAVRNAAELEALLSGLPDVRYRLADGTLHLYYTAPAIAPCRRGLPAFCNGILAHLPGIDHAAYADQAVHTAATNRVCGSDGEELDARTVNELIDIHDRIAYAHRWAPGDLLIIDNTRYLHGRRMTVRPCRRLLLSRFGWLEPAVAATGRPPAAL